jgi:5-methylcytosine-specific restriction endonuclease McrA
MPKENVVIKACKTHGTTDFVLEGRGYYRCKTCRRERVAEQRRKNKRILVQEHGGQCVLCGYNKSIRALHFHHVDPTQKSFGLAFKGKTPGIKKMREEAKKCVLLCSNCHMEVEDGMHNNHAWSMGKTAPC